MNLVRLSIICCGLFAHHALAGDWPQFCGPGGTGVAIHEKNLVRAFPDSGPAVLWSLKLGQGFGGAAIRDGKVYILDRIGSKQDILRVLDLDTGKELWTFAYDAPGSVPYAGSRNVPTVEKDRVYITGPFGHIHCIDLATHKPIWSANAVKDYDNRRLPRPLAVRVPTWGFTQHPVIHGDMFIVAPHALDAGLVALDKNTGKELWRSSDIGRNIYCHVTPYVATLCGVEQVVTIGNKDGGKDPPAVLSGVDLKTGRILWQTETHKRYNVPIPQPLKIADDKLFFTGGYTIGCFALKLTAPKDPAEPWKVDYAFKDNNAITSHIHNPVLYENHVIAQSFDKFHQNVHNGLTCIDLDGKIKWKTGPDVTFDSGSFLIADGLIITMHGDKGELVLAEASTTEYKELARAKVLEGRGRMIWANIALSNGRLVIRDQNEMKCIDLRQK